MIKIATATVTARAGSVAYRTFLPCSSHDRSAAPKRSLSGDARSGEVETGEAANWTERITYG